MNLNDDMLKLEGLREEIASTPGVFVEKLRKRH
jgi:hypothetical protein